LVSLLVADSMRAGMLKMCVRLPEVASRFLRSDTDGRWPGRTALPYSDAAAGDRATFRPRLGGDFHHVGAAFVVAPGLTCP
jgi:hypothetical protein